MTTRELEKIIQPQTELELKLLSTPEFRVGLAWGEPRFGHPEGAVCYHVAEIMDNIRLISSLSPEEKQKLRLIALAHDTFKFAETKVRPRNWELHHGKLARRFLEKYTDEVDVLEIIQWHDEAYYCWRAAALPNLPSDTQNDFDGLMRLIDPFAQLYYLFTKCDTQTGDKNQAPLRWFEKHASNIQYVPVRERNWAL